MNLSQELIEALARIKPNYNVVMYLDGVVKDVNSLLNALDGTKHDMTICVVASFRYDGRDHHDNYIISIREDRIIKILATITSYFREDDDRNRVDFGDFDRRIDPLHASLRESIKYKPNSLRLLDVKSELSTTFIRGLIDTAYHYYENVNSIKVFTKKMYSITFSQIVCTDNKFESGALEFVVNGVRYVVLFREGIAKTFKVYRCDYGNYVSDLGYMNLELSVYISNPLYYSQFLHMLHNTADCLVRQFIR